MPKYQFSCEVVAQYIAEQSDPDESIYGFAYTVTITNTGDIAAQLISRHWTIVDNQGMAEEVTGLGVVGQQPLLKPGEAFQYHSGSRLRTHSGTMHGSYTCVATDGESFEAEIPMFVLEASLPSDNENAGHSQPQRTLH